MDTGMVGSGERTRASVVYPEAGSRQESSSVFRTKPPEAFTFVLFGATGDLANRKLFPALASLLKNGYLPPSFVVIGTGRREKTDQTFRDEAQKDLARFRPNGSAEHTADFLKHVFYQQTDFT